ncbi:hypothetical protein MKEN_00777000 [Mycena kentingensis (nom. inval.)]|nr:hypothetical protein MKEN_00777000 [Mycena kentingensis (nom. inval.)]
MARATRSQDTTKSPKHEHKKRKLVDDALDDHPDKLQRTDAPPLASTNPIPDDTAATILHILESIDEQGLLDRVYESPHSLRSLLESPGQHSLATLRAAVVNLRPLSSHPRLPAYAPAAQQSRFCDTALSLLDQASQPQVYVGLDTISPLLDDEDESHHPLSTKRYALVQRLPDGDYFTSINLDLSSETGTGNLKDLPTGHAELVAVYPEPSLSSLPPKLPKLGDYSRKLGYGARRFTPAQSRRISHGQFLDYGPNTSFAPTWHQDGAEVGMRQMSEYYSQRAKRVKERFLAAQNTDAQPEKPQKAPIEPPPSLSEEAIDPDLDSLRDILAPNEIESLTAVLGNLELENSVQELLERNRRALRRLGQLQTRRLRFENGRKVSEDEEEWELAQSILQSLTLLASMRPRSSAHPTAPLIPPPDVIHTLMNTLPRAAVPGWHGTLPDSGAALRDDTTVRVRPGVPAKPPAPDPATNPSTPANMYYQQPSAFYAPPTAQGRPTQTRYGTRANSSAVAAPVQMQQFMFSGGASGTHTPYGSSGWVQYQGNTTPGNIMFANAGSATPVTGSKAVANTVRPGAAGAWAGTPTLPLHMRSGVAG